MSRECVNSQKVCGEFTSKSQTKYITPVLKKSHELYFGCKVGDQDKSWAPHSCSSRYSRLLRGWLIGTHQSMLFAIPMVWREYEDHLTDCCCCLTKIDDHNFKSKHTKFYPNIPSALRPVEHDDSLPNPKPPQQWALHKEEPTSNSPEDETGPSCSNVDPDFPELTVRHFTSQSELNDLVRDLNLSKL
jgi:hypothetical protein